MQKKCAIGETYNVTKFEVFILERQRIDQKRKKGWGRGRRERIEKGSRERIEAERKGNFVNNLKRGIRNIDIYLCLMFSFLKALVKYSSGVR